MKYLACWVAVSLAGCSLADPDLYRALEDGGGGVDGGTDSDVPMDGGDDTGGGDDGGTNMLVDECGDPDVFVISDTLEDIEVDTTGLFNDIGTLGGCNNLSVPGPEGFLAVDVQAGEEWHFHLRVDERNDPDPTARNPTLYVLNSACSGTMCAEDLLANFCDQQQDEHFAFEFGAAGRFYIAIDDRNSGGGRYLLDAIKPFCGDGTPEHGEACEGDEGCGSDCRWMLTEDSVQERGFNFNFKEANRVVLPASDELEIRADIGGFEGCGYPDVFAVNVPGGANLRVEQRNGDGTACAGAGSPDLRMTLRNANNDIRGGEVVAGCPVIDETFSGDGGLFFVVVEDQRPDISRPLSYRLHFQITP